MSIFTDEWSQKIAIIQSKLSSAIHESMLVAASVVYSAILSYTQQQQLITEWNSLVNSLQPFPSLDELFVDILSSQKEQDNWMKVIQSKHVSVMNNILRLRCVTFLGEKCWPLVIDPYDQSEELVKLIEDDLISPGSYL